jgi:hypothetical protein
VPAGYYEEENLMYGWIGMCQNDIEKADPLIRVLKAKDAKSLLLRVSMPAMIDDLPLFNNPKGGRGQYIQPIQTEAIHKWVKQPAKQVRAATKPFMHALSVDPKYLTMLPEVLGKYDARFTTIVKKNMEKPKNGLLMQINDEELVYMNDIGAMIVDQAGGILSRMDLLHLPKRPKEYYDDDDDEPDYEDTEWNKLVARGFDPRFVQIDNEEAEEQKEQDILASWEEDQPDKEVISGPLCCVRLVLSALDENIDNLCTIIKRCIV